MAKVDFKMPEEFLLKVSRLAEKTDEIIPKVLEAGAEVVYDKVKSNLSSVVGKTQRLKAAPPENLNLRLVYLRRSRTEMVIST